MYGANCGRQGVPTSWTSRSKAVQAKNCVSARVDVQWKSKEHMQEHREKDDRYDEAMEWSDLHVSRVIFCNEGEQKHEASLLQ